MYAQAPTIATVRHAPANPEIMKLVIPPSNGKTAIIHGITKTAVTCAMMPATKPKTAIIPEYF